MANFPSLSLSLFSATIMTNPEVLGNSSRPTQLIFVFILLLRVKGFHLEIISYNGTE